VPELRDALLRGRNWPAVAEMQRKTHFGPASRKLAQERMQSLIKAFDFLAEMEPQVSGGSGHGRPWQPASQQVRQQSSRDAADHGASSGGLVVAHLLTARE
jgi:hypothetical protein